VKPTPQTIKGRLQRLAERRVLESPLAKNGLRELAQLVA
jgi:hypothetical protein